MKGEREVYGKIAANGRTSNRFTAGNAVTGHAGAMSSSSGDGAVLLLRGPRYEVRLLRCLWVCSNSVLRAI